MRLIASFPSHFPLQSFLKHPTAGDIRVDFFIVLFEEENAMWLGILCHVHYIAGFLLALSFMPFL